MFHGEFPPLRDFQTRAHEALRDGARNGHRKQVIMAPTGSGKTILAMNIIKQALDKGRRAMFVCDRKTLIQQTSEVARSLGLGRHSIIQADNPRLNLFLPFQIASCQTLMRRGWPETDVIIIDECHSLYRTWVDHVKSEACKARVIGLSATPFAKGMGQIFSNLINAATMDELTKQGILVPMRIFSCHRPDMTGAETTNGGEWTDRAAEERELRILGDVLSEWQKLAHGLKTIVFGATIRHCEELALRFRQCGIGAAAFCADTPDDERKQILQDFEAGRVQVLLSVEALAKGFDVRDVGCVCDCRPLRKSLSTAIQMWGRGLRSSPETDKTECKLLDFSGNAIRFADEFADIYFNGLSRLDEGEKLDKEVRKDEEKESRCCPKCGYSPMGKRCVSCGYAPQPKAAIEHGKGTMEEIFLLGKDVMAENPEHLWAQLVAYAMDHSQPGKQQGRAAHLFRDITGKWPPRHFRVDTAPEIEPSPATYRKIKQLNIAFSRRKWA